MVASTFAIEKEVEENKMSMSISRTKRTEVEAEAPVQTRRYYSEGRRGRVATTTEDPGPICPDRPQI